MIRRAIWLVLGAALGIAGYRRLSRVVRAIAPGSVTQPALRQQPPGAATFVRDVRAGMTEYLDRHRGYMDRHPGRLGNTLVGQRARRQRAGIRQQQQP